MSQKINDSNKKYDYNYNYNHKHNDPPPIVVEVRPGWKSTKRETKDLEPTTIIQWKEEESSSTVNDDNHKQKKNDKNEIFLVPLNRNVTADIPQPQHNQQQLQLVICGVCQINESRYTCPRCQLLYCSVNCYRVHTQKTKTLSSSTTSSISNNENEAVSACTEAFYKNRVSSILELETKEHQKTTHQMLNRHYQQSILSNNNKYNDTILSNGNGILTTPYNNNTNNDDDDDDAITDELYELLLALENGEWENNMDDTNNNDKTTTTIKSSTNKNLTTLLNKLSPTLRFLLEQDLQSGKIQEMVLQKWHPWWQQEISIPSSSSSPLTTQNDIHKNDNNNENEINVNHNYDHEYNAPNNANNASKVKTLDERLLKIPKWETIRPKQKSKQQKQRQQPQPQQEGTTQVIDYSFSNQKQELQEQEEEQSNLLLYNLVDIVYSICWTLRLYHGVENAIETEIESSSSSSAATLSSLTSETANTTTSSSTSSIDTASDTASMTLLNGSAVLNNKDTRYMSLEQVLMACTELSTKHYPNQGCNTSWDILVQDVSAIFGGGEKLTIPSNSTIRSNSSTLLASRRLVGRALLEGRDILSAAIQKFKQSTAKTSTSSSSISNSAPDPILAATTISNHLTKLRLVRKKLDFYLSFSQSTALSSSQYESVQTTLREWVHHWSTM